MILSTTVAVLSVTLVGCSTCGKESKATEKVKDIVNNSSCIISHPCGLEYMW